MSSKQVKIAISFPIPLEAALAEEHAFILNKENKTPSGEEHDLECPGTAAEPEAAAGYLCVYTTRTINLANAYTHPCLPTTVGCNGAEGAGETGALVPLLEEAEKPLHSGWGTWAVTAP